MAKWISVSSANICLVADPNKLTATGQQGELTLVYQNDSYVPLTATIVKLRSSDPKVATPTSTTPSLRSIDIPGRSRSGIRKDSKAIGSWSPLSQGDATLDADVDMHDDAGHRLSAGTPSDYVEVT